MAQEVCVTVSTEDRACLAAIIDDRNRPLKHILIILFSAVAYRFCRWRGAPALQPTGDNVRAIGAAG